MKKTNYLLCLLAVITFAFVSTSCGKDEPTPSGGSEEPEKPVTPSDPDDPSALDISYGENTSFGIRFDGLYYILGASDATLSHADAEIQNAKLYTKIKYSGKIYDLTKLGNSCFAHCQQLSEIDIPESITAIGDYAFTDCTSLSSIQLPSTIKSIGNGAFDGCSSLESIILPANITTISSSTFAGCSKLTKIELPAGLKTIEQTAFYNSGIAKLNFPENLETIGDYAFGFSKLTDVDLQGTKLTSLGKRAFYQNANLKKLRFPSSLKVIEEKAFAECSSLEDIDFNGVTEIKDEAFIKCSKLKQLYLNSSVTTLGSSAFSECSSLESVKADGPNKSIGSYCFSQCFKMRTFSTNSAAPYAIKAGSFETKYASLCTLYIPVGSKEAYEKAGYGNFFGNIVEQ